jgi:hypothetical protein
VGSALSAAAPVIETWLDTSEAQGHAKERNTTNVSHQDSLANADPVRSITSQLSCDPDRIGYRLFDIGKVLTRFVPEDAVPILKMEKAAHDCPLPSPLST